jgi:hypothetical protein
MIKRLSSLPRPASILRSAPVAARAFTAPTAPVSGVKPSNVVLELDVKQVGTEMRKRGLASSVSSASGMDRVSGARNGPRRFDGADDTGHYRATALFLGVQARS